MKLRTFSRSSLFAVALAAAPALAGCLTSDVSVNDAKSGLKSDGGAVIADDSASADAATVKYRDLASHPGCTTDGLTYPAAQIPGYKCAAKAYPVTNEDPKKPIVILVHGNSSTPANWEKFPADDPKALPMLSERLGAAGFRTYAVDFRIDKVDDPNQNNDTENAAKNYDHGWAVPILEHLIDSVMTANPDRKVSIVGFSVGPTVVRDALRRLHRAKKAPFARIAHLVLAAGAHHGVSTYRKLCSSNPTMRGRITCELGDRTAFTPTDFSKPLNGPDGAFETPCGDGDHAYGAAGACGGNTVKYTTVVMQDVKEGTYQDEFVSEGASALKGADNKTVPLDANDLSGYFLKGLFKNHYGAIRSEAALTIIMAALSA